MLGTWKKLNWWYVAYVFYENGNKTILGGATVHTETSFMTERQREDLRNKLQEKYSGRCIITSISNIGKATLAEMNE